MQSQAESIDREIAEDRSVNYRGTVRVRFEFLEFDVESARELDKKNVERLVGVYETARCLRLKPEHHIPAVISQQNLNLAIKHTGTSLEKLLIYPQKLPPELKFPPGHRLICLHGQHRVEAAKQWGKLSPKEKWWAVDLYLDDSSPELKRSLIEQYSNSANFSDGEIYLKIRHYQSEPNVFAESRWWSYLSKSKQRYLKLFVKHSTLAAGFDALRVLPALFGGLKIGTLDKAAASKCVEEIAHYLRHIFNIWSTILGEDRELMGLTDRATVEALQLRVPGLCSEDSKALESRMRDGELFPKVRDQQRRQAIWNNLKSIKCPIPSIYSLRKDLRYLRPLANIMKGILKISAKSRSTVRTAMENSFVEANQHEGQVQVQETELTLRPYRGNLDDQVDLGIWQAWLYLMRHFTDMVPECPKKENGKEAPVPKRSSPAAWHRFATLMYRLGFESEEIHRLRLKDPDRERARTTLLDARDLEHYEYNERDFESHQDQMVKMFKSARRIEQPNVAPFLFVDGPGEDLERRCGRTFEDAYEYDRKFLFLNVIGDSDWAGGRGITSLFVRISVCFAFFGRPIFSTGAREAVDQGSQSTELFMAPAGPGDPTPMPQQRQSPGLSTDAGQGFQTAATAQLDGPSSDIPRQDEVIGSLREELTTCRREVDALQAQKTTLEGDIRGKDKELGDLRDRQRSSSEDLENARKELQTQSTANGELEKRLSEAQSEANTLRSERDRLSVDLTTAQSRLKALDDMQGAISTTRSEMEALRAEKAKLEEDKAAIESELRGSLTTAQSEIASLRVEKNKLEGDEAVLSNLRAQIIGLKAEIMELKSCHDDAQQAFTANSEGLRREITRLEAERMEATTRLEDVEKEKQDLQSQMDTMVASLSNEIESLTRSRDTEGDQRSRAEEQCQTMQKNLDLENQGKREAIEKLTKSQRETKRMAAKIGTLEAELKILRAQVTAPTAPPTVEQGTPLAPEVQSANEAPVDDTFTSVLNEPLNAQNSLPNIFEQIPNLGEQRRMPTSAKRQSMLPPLLQRPFPESDPRTRVVKHVDQPRMMNRIGKSGVVAASRMNKIQARTRGPQAGKLFFNEVLFKIVEESKISSTSTAIPFERTQVENSAKGYWPMMHLFSSTGQGILPRMCFDTLVQEGTQTIFLIPKGHQVDVNQELINTGIREDPQLDEGERVVEIESENEELVQPEAHQSRKRKRSIHDDLQRPPTNDHEQGETSMVRYKGAKRAQYPGRVQSGTYQQHI